MEPYALVEGAGPFTASVNAFIALVEELQSAAAAGLTACGLEDLLAERGREVQRQLLQDHLYLWAAREERAACQDHPATAGADGITRTRVEAGHHRQLATLFGTVQVTRCAWRRPGAPNLCPADAALSLPASGRPALPSGWRRWRPRGSFEAAHAAITRRCGPVIGKRQVEQAMLDAACDIAAFYASRVPVPCTASTLLVISADAKGIVMRPGALRPATAKAAARQGRMRTRLAAGERLSSEGRNRPCPRQKRIFSVRSAANKYSSLSSRTVPGNRVRRTASNTRNPVIIVRVREGMPSMTVAPPPPGDGATAGSLGAWPRAC